MVLQNCKPKVQEVQKKLYFQLEPREELGRKRLVE